MPNLLATFAVLVSFSASAAAEKLYQPAIGEHYKILTFEKNENPQNIMIVFTKLDKDCRFVKTGDKPLVDFYWLLNKERFKQTNRLIKANVRKRLVVEPSTGHLPENSFRLKISDLKELKTDKKQTYMLVQAERNGSSCSLTTWYPDQGKMLEVNSLYSETSKTLIPPFRKILSVTLNGVDPETNQPVQRKLLAR